MTNRCLTYLLMLIIEFLSDGYFFLFWITILNLNYAAYLQNYVPFYSIVSSWLSFSSLFSIGKDVLEKKSMTIHESHILVSTLEYRYPRMHVPKLVLIPLGFLWDTNSLFLVESEYYLYFNCRYEQGKYAELCTHPLYLCLYGIS